MKDLIRLTDWSVRELQRVFKTADDMRLGIFRNLLNGKTIIMFFPENSIRTRVTFERGIYLLGGQPIIFPPETLEKKEDISDVMGYLNNWASAAIIRYQDIKMLDEAAKYADFPIINAMTDCNHPCEILSDLYALSLSRHNIYEDHYLFVGPAGNIGFAWKEAASVLGLKFRQCCPAGYEMDGVEVIHNLEEAIQGMDIICTDSVPTKDKEAFKDYQITKAHMDQANSGALLNPCPPFYRGEEVSEDVIDSDYFVGYDFKRYLLEIQQAVIIECLKEIH
jgi:ornithine carbamoyltransferase